MSHESAGTEIRVILASHDRRDLTLQAIRRARLAGRFADTETRFYVFDDGSKDGTSAALRAEGPDVQVLRGDGTAFWAKGMSIAESQAIRDSDRQHRTFLLWMNDDIVLHTDAIQRLLKVHDNNWGSVVVGSLADPETGAITYGGYQRRGLHPLAFHRVPPSSRATEITAFNGNLVLIPASVHSRIGGIDGQYAHGYADIEYGVRCKNSGIRVILAPGTFGTCPRNKPLDHESLKKAWDSFVSTKGPGQPKSLARILRTISPRTWPVFFAAVYAKWIVSHVVLTFAKLFDKVR